MNTSRTADAPGAHDAPVADAASRPVRPGELRRAAVESGGLPFATAPVLFLLIPIIYAWIERPLAAAVITTGVLAIYGVLFVLSCGVAEYPLRVRLAWFAASTALILLLIPVIGTNVLFMVMFQAMMHMLLLPWRWAVPSMVIMCATVVLIGLALQVYAAVTLAVMALMASWGVGYGIRQQKLQERLDAAERCNAVLAVAAERERIGRDLHDILGHSLTSATVSAQLAQRLLEVDPDAAREQLVHIEQTVRQSLADVRATSSGMQTVRAATEIASARSVLTAVGIDAHVPTAMPMLDDPRAELFGYVIREAVTNIVRHSGASSARIAIDETTVSITDDGIGIPGGAVRTGLRGLQQRVSDAGGELTVDSSAEGTTITAALGADGAVMAEPGPRPASAPAPTAPLPTADPPGRDAAFAELKEHP